MKYVDADKIRAEIERMISAHKTKNGFPKGSFCAVRIEAYNEVLGLLDALEEPVIEGLEEEIERACAVIEEKNPQHRGLKPSGIAKIARHFAEWGRKQVLQEIYDGKVKPVDKITAAWLDDEQNT